MSFLDKTFCASPNCKNECGRKMSEKEKAQKRAFEAAQRYILPVSYGYFCGEPELSLHDELCREAAFYSMSRMDDEQ